MTGFQKFIKYASIIFGTYLSVIIIGVILIVIMSIFGAFIGIEHFRKNIDNNENDRYYENRQEYNELRDEFENLIDNL